MSQGRAATYWKAGYDEGYRDGESSLLADVNTLCDQLGIELGDNQHEFDAIREEVRRLRRVVEEAQHDA